MNFFGICHTFVTAFMLQCRNNLVTDKGELMEQNRQHLKIASWVILAMAVVSFLRTAVTIMLEGLAEAMLPDESAAVVTLFVKILLLVFAFVFLLPQLFVGVRGLRIVKNPATTKKGHIVWAWILLVLTALGQVENIGALVEQGALLTKLYSALLGLISVASYIYYIWAAKAVAKTN